jgi:hypothetical protein
MSLQSHYIDAAHTGVSRTVSPFPQASLVDAASAARPPPFNPEYLKVLDGVSHGVCQTRRQQQQAALEMFEAAAV